MAWEVLENVRAAESGNEGTEDEGERAVSGSLEGIASAGLRGLSAKKLYSPVREKYFLGSLRRRLGSCFELLCCVLRPG